ncbi:hypothetical protein [Glaciecola petra]|uniref:PEP-CTERM sorting domain-containing protein n=1 Tax=Glaciecola petra TaxID=3075602 RepID=A0ABU2ZQP9_9ALTE|nr:hypothetical protein [Aestuariibacter sp. P117]MDT0594959.1 hypothetical protein [Aestuariibacter sp. P117]
MRITTKNIFSSFIIVASLLISASTMANIIASDSFDYSDGTINGQNGGFGWNGSWGGSHNLENGVVKGSSVSFRNLQTSISHKVGTRVYIEFDMAADSAPNNDFSGISFYNGGNEELFFGLSFATDVYGINWTGYYNGETGPAVTTRFDSLVGEVIFGSVDTIVNLFVNSGGQLTTPIDTFTADTSSLGGSWDRIRIAGNVQSMYDNLSISVVNAPSTIGILFLSLVLLNCRRCSTNIS